MRRRNPLIIDARHQRCSRRHPGGSRGPVSSQQDWIPACAGMTGGEVIRISYVSAHAPDPPKNSIAPQCRFASLFREEQFVNPRVERTGSHAISRRPEAGRLKPSTAGLTCFGTLPKRFSRANPRMQWEPQQIPFPAMTSLGKLQPYRIPATPAGRVLGTRNPKAMPRGNFLSPLCLCASVVRTSYLLPFLVAGCSPERYTPKYRQLATVAMTLENSCGTISRSGPGCVLVARHYRRISGEPNQSFDLRSVSIGEAPARRGPLG